MAEKGGKSGIGTLKGKLVSERRNLKRKTRADDEDISTGFVLTSLNNPVHAVRQFEAQLAILEHKNIICAGYSCVLHVHTLSEEVNLAVRPPSQLNYPPPQN